MSKNLVLLNDRVKSWIGRPRKSSGRTRRQATRPHKSFRLTRRRAYVKTVKLPSYWQAAIQPIADIIKYRRTLGGFALAYAAISAIIIGLSSQDAYQQLSGAASSLGKIMSIEAVGQAFAVALAGLAGDIPVVPISQDGVLAALLALIAWLSVIWLARAIMRGDNPRIRDGVYNAGAPLVPMVVLAFILLLQLIPAFLAIIGMQAGISSGYMTVGVEGMLLAIPAVLMVGLSLYWAVVTAMSTVIVTLPGMYPLEAHRHAYGLVGGRRVTFVLRWLWSVLIVAIAWLALLTPVIIVERFAVRHVEFIDKVPVVPAFMTLLASFSLTYLALYSYQLYRSAVEHDAE